MGGGASHPSEVTVDPWNRLRNAFYVFLFGLKPHQRMPRFTRKLLWLFTWNLDGYWRQVRRLAQGIDSSNFLLVESIVSSGLVFLDTILDLADPDAQVEGIAAAKYTFNSSNCDSGDAMSQSSLSKQPFSYVSDNGAIRMRVALGPLHRSALYGTADITALLLSAKANVDLRDSFGRTPLVCAARRGHREVASMLINAGADLNAVDMHKCSPLITAINASHVELARDLITSKADPQVADDMGQSPLYLASKIGLVALPDLLLSNKADCNRQCRHGDTALIAACSFGHSKIVQCLLDAKANVYSRARNGRNAMDSANFYKKGDHANCCRLLREANSVETRLPRAKMIRTSHSGRKASFFSPLRRSSYDANSDSLYLQFPVKKYSTKKS